MKPYPEMPPGITRAHDGAVLRVRFDRPERRNSLTDAIVYALTDTMDAAASDESVQGHPSRRSRASTSPRASTSQSGRPVPSAPGWARSTDA